MQHKPRYRLMRRILFPYSGEQPLSLKQSLRVMLAWVLFFPLGMSLLTLRIIVFGLYPVLKMLIFVIFTFFSYVFIFGFLCLFFLFLFYIVFCLMYFFNFIYGR